MIPCNSIDVVVSNCVLNLIDTIAKKQMFTELYRLLKRGGRAIISDIISSNDVPPAMCNRTPNYGVAASAALFVRPVFRAFADNGFDTVRILDRAENPWCTVNEIEFRSVTVEAVKNSTNQKTETNYFTPRISANPKPKTDNCSPGCC